MEAGPDMRVVADIAIVVVIHEGMAAHRVVQGERGGNQQKAENKSLPLGGERRAAVFLKGEQQMDLITPHEAGGITRKARRSSD